MVHQSYRVFALVLVFALMFGMLAAMAPATVQAGSDGHAAKKDASFTADQMLNPVERDFEGKCKWWWYEYQNGRYVRKYCPCRFGDTQIDYSKNHRQLWAQSLETEMLADIVDTAVAAGDFETLVAAVQAAGLVDTLKGEGPFTVFAPSDEAFAALPAGTIESLLAEPQGALTDILLYHVVVGKVMAADVVSLDGESVETVGGKSFLVTIDGDSVKVDESNVVATDIEASNGVIHVIDAVLIPAK